MKIEVKFKAETSIDKAVKEMIELADRLDIYVYTNFNGACVDVWKGSDAITVVNEYHQAVGNKIKLRSGGSR